MKHKEQGICKPILAIITLKNSDNKITSKSTSIAIKSQGNMFFLALFLFKFKITCGMLIWNLMSVCPSGLQSWTQLSPTISNIKALGTEALTMSLNPFCTCLFTVFHYTFISQLLSLGAGTADRSGIKTKLMKSPYINFGLICDLSVEKKEVQWFSC